MRLASVITVFACVVLGTACSGGSAEAPSCANPTETTTVLMDDFSYAPTCVSVDEGATLSLDNRGAAPHTFTLEGTAVDADVAAGEQGSAELTGVASGTYTVTCTYHPQMVAALKVGT